MHNFNRPFRVGGKSTEGKQRGNGNSYGEATDRFHLSTFFLVVMHASRCLRCKRV
ncbi:hypothetical protein AK972_1184 [Pseudomonas yamanorum]|nr:hypothetical protein AK972_1184 [Pseudomonas yamanorum]